MTRDDTALDLPPPVPHVYGTLSNIPEDRLPRWMKANPHGTNLSELAQSSPDPEPNPVNLSSPAGGKAASDNFDLEKGGVKFDGGKPRLDLVPMDATLAVACVFTYGAIKYDDWNWAKGMRRGRILAALMRHVAAYMMGEELDDESGLPHTWHMGCCTLMLISADLRGVAVEDRNTSVEAYKSVQALFKGMKNPAQTVKNGGKSIVDPTEEEDKPA